MAYTNQPQGSDLIGDGEPEILFMRQEQQRTQASRIVGSSGTTAAVASWRDMWTDGSDSAKSPSSHSQQNNNSMPPSPSSLGFERERRGSEGEGPAVFPFYKMEQQSALGLGLGVSMWERSVVSPKDSSRSGTGDLYDMDGSGGMASGSGVDGERRGRERDYHMGTTRFSDISMTASVTSSRNSSTVDFISEALAKSNHNHNQNQNQNQTTRPSFESYRSHQSVDIFDNRPSMDRDILDRDIIVDPSVNIQPTSDRSRQPPGPLPPINTSASYFAVAEPMTPTPKLVSKTISKPRALPVEPILPPPSTSIPPIPKVPDLLPLSNVDLEPLEPPPSVVTLLNRGESPSPKSGGKSPMASAFPLPPTMQSPASSNFPFKKGDSPVTPKKGSPIDTVAGKDVPRSSMETAESEISEATVAVKKVSSGYKLVTATPSVLSFKKSKDMSKVMSQTETQMQNPPTGDQSSSATSSADYITKKSNSRTESALSAGKSLKSTDEEDSLTRELSEAISKLNKGNGNFAAYRGSEIDDLDIPLPTPNAHDNWEDKGLLSPSANQDAKRDPESPRYNDFSATSATFSPDPRAEAFHPLMKKIRPMSNESMQSLPYTATRHSSYAEPALPPFQLPDFPLPENLKSHQPLTESALANLQLMSKVETKKKKGHLKGESFSTAISVPMSELIKRPDSSLMRGNSTYYEEEKKFYIDPAAMKRNSTTWKDRVAKWSTPLRSPEETQQQSNSRNSTYGKSSLGYVQHLDTPSATTPSPSYNEPAGYFDPPSVKPEIQNFNAKKGPRSSANSSSAPSSKKKKKKKKFSRKQKIIIATLIVLLLIGAVLAGILGLSNRGGGKSSDEDNNKCQCIDGSDFTDSCPALAAGIITGINTAQRLFQPQIDVERLAFVFSEYFSAPPSKNGDCADQFKLIDVPNFNNFPGRVTFAHAAILWDLAQQEATKSGLKKFAESLDLSSLRDRIPVTQSQIGSINSANSAFQFTSAGFVYDFKDQTVISPTADWVSDTSPQTAQLAAVQAAGVESILDTLTTASIATDSQRSTALQHFWMDSLKMDLSDLVTFVSNVQTSNVMIPFDATSFFDSKPISSLENGDNSFPPAISCYPGSTFSETEINTINSLEANAFSLDSISSTSSADTICTSRPLYGILNLLNLRLPFVEDSARTNLPRQAIVLTNAVRSRVTVHAGEVLVGLLQGTPNSSLSSPFSSANNFGNFNHLSSVLISYLSLMSNDTAKLVAEYVVSSSDDPPTGALLDVIGEVPLLEVAVWGGVKSSDISFAMSSISNSNGTLFFGSSEGLAFRSISNTITWSKKSTDVSFAKETSRSETKFNTVWNSTSNAGEDAVFSALSDAGLVSS